MDAYRTYLRGELGKLANEGDGQAFLDRSGFRALGTTASDLVQRFATQQLVDAVVAAMSLPELIAVADACSRWRGNGVADRLRGHGSYMADVPVGSVYLRPAEGWVTPVFAANGWRLVEIARDPRVLAGEPYRGLEPGRRVEFATLLADEQGSGLFRLIDGMHRAIQLVRNGEQIVRLCVVQ